MNKYLYFKCDSNFYWVWKIKRECLSAVKVFTDRDKINLIPITYKDFSTSTKSGVIIKEESDINKYWFKAHLN